MTCRSDVGVGGSFLCGGVNVSQRRNIPAVDVVSCGIALTGGRSLETSLVQTQSALLN